MDIKEFLTTVITAKEGFFNLFIKPSGESIAWEEWFVWPTEIDKILARIETVKAEYNVYFSSYLFAKAHSSKENVLPSRTIQADLDDADISQISIVPTILIETSPGRHQGYWILDKELDIDAHEVLSRKLTHSIPLCDHSGWPVGRKVRVPGTLNFKYLDGPKEVKITNVSLVYYDPSVLEFLPEIHKEIAEIDANWIDNPPTTYSIGPQEILESIKHSIPPKIYVQYNTVAKDRSRALWALTNSAFRAGLSRNEVFWLAKHSANNKFSNLRYRGDSELAKDILRAESVTKNRIIDVKQAISDARKITASTVERRQLISIIVLEHLKKLGVFIRTTDDNIWYIIQDLGRPIIISPRSEWLAMIMDLQFGLNATEIEQSYTINSLAAYSRNLPITATTGALSYYDSKSNTIIIHSGKKNIYRITEDSIDEAVNGAYGVVFPWITSNEPFIPKLDSDLSCWASILYEATLDNIIGLEKEEAFAILKVWTLFLLMRNSAISRPILALFGQPGAGKSTLFRRVYTMLYGKNRSLGAVTNPDDFDHSVSVDPLVVLDNVDTWAPWLPDRLALSASTSDIIKRKLYTDVDTITVKRQALIGITAHNPRFGREDVADRLLLFNFERLKKFLPEGDIIDNIYTHRNDIWGAIILDLQKVLREPLPRAEDSPQFRIEDFARIGWRIARALNICEPFACALRKIAINQKIFSLEEDYLLVSALQNMIRKNPNGAWKSIGTLWSDLEICSADAGAFQKAYKNAVYLGKKLWALQESLKEIFDINWNTNPQTGIRTWNIKEKQNA